MTHLNRLQMNSALTKAFGQITVVRKEGSTNEVVASVKGWHGPQNATDQQKAALSIEAKNSAEALHDLYNMIVGMANGGIEVDKGQTFEYEGRYTTRNAKDQEVTYHTGEDKRFPSGFYLDGKPNQRMR